MPSSFVVSDPAELFKSPVSALGYPFIQIYYNAVQSLPGTNAMVSVSLVIIIMAHFGLMAGCSRTAWVGIFLPKHEMHLRATITDGTQPV